MVMCVRCFLRFYWHQFQVNTLNEQEWEKIQQQHVLTNVQLAFDTSDTEEDSESVLGTFDMLSPSGHTDAQTLACMLQEQLDAINNEIRYRQQKILLDAFVVAICFICPYFCGIFTKYFNEFSVCKIKGIFTLFG